MSGALEATITDVQRGASADMCNRRVGHLDQ
jgi:hypothetical protein